MIINAVEELCAEEKSYGIELYRLAKDEPDKEKLGIDKKWKSTDENSDGIAERGIDFAMELHGIH